jgi:hypothetical protein
MPATSIKQRRYFAWAEHNPAQARAEGKMPSGMNKQQMSDFASTPEKGLPETAPAAPKPFRPKRKYYGAKI